MHILYSYITSFKVIKIKNEIPNTLSLLVIFQRSISVNSNVRMVYRNKSPFLFGTREGPKPKGKPNLKGKEW